MGPKTFLKDPETQIFKVEQQPKLLLVASRGVCMN